jgi:hypothetical protein
LAQVTPKNVNDFIALAGACPLSVYTDDGGTYTVAGCPFDAILSNVSQADFDEILLALPGIMEVERIA